MPFRRTVCGGVHHDLPHIGADKRKGERKDSVDLRSDEPQTYSVPFFSPGEKSAKAAEKLFPDSQRPDELWMYVVWVLLFLLVMEVFVANRTPA